MLDLSLEMREAAQMCLHYADELFDLADSQVDIASLGVNLCEEICRHASQVIASASNDAFDGDSENQSLR